MKHSGIRGFEATICCQHIHGLYRQQVAVLILHPNRVKTDMGEYNVPRPVEKDAELAAVLLILKANNCRGVAPS